jgi:rRNA-processing protein FCF1
MEKIKKIVADTNFLVDMVRFKLDMSDIDVAVGRAEIVVFDSVIAELKSLAREKTSSGRFAALALKIVKTRKMNVIGKSGKADDTILDFAKDFSEKFGTEDLLVATNDGVLREKLKKLGIKTIYLRARKYLAIE